MPHFTDLAIQLIADAKIRQAYDDGKFRNLPGYGKPMDFGSTDNPHWWTSKMLKREGFRIVTLADSGRDSGKSK